MIQIVVIFTLAVVTTATPGYINSVPTYHNTIALQAAPIALTQPIVQTIPQDVSYTRTDIISRKVTGSAPSAAYVDHHGVAGYVENSVPHSVKHIHYIEENILRNGQSTQQNEAEPILEDKLRQIQIPQPQKIIESSSSSEAQSRQVASNSMSQQRQTLAQSQPPQPQYLPGLSRISQEQQQEVNVQQQQQQQQDQQQQQRQSYELQPQYLPSIAKIAQEQHQQAYIDQQQQQQWQQQQLQQLQQHQQLQLQQQAQLQQTQISSEAKSTASVTSTAENQQSQQLQFQQPQFNTLQGNFNALQYKSPALQIYNNPKPVEHPAPRLQEDTESITTDAADTPLATESINNNQQPQHLGVSHSIIPAGKLSYSVINAPQIALTQHTAIPATYSSSALVSSVYPAASSSVTYPIAGVEKTYYPATAARIESLATPTVYHTPTVYNAPLKLAQVHHAPALAYNVAQKVVENPVAIQYSNVY